MEEYALHIEPLDRLTVKIVLSKKDMQRFCLTYEKMDYDDPTTKKVIVHLLKRVRESTRMDFGLGKLFIEAFPNDDGGCILYLNSVESPKESSLYTSNGFNMPLIVKLTCVDDLLDICKCLIYRWNHLILKSSLYENENEYFLLLYSYYKQDDKLCAILQEFGKLSGRGDLASSLIHEHNNMIIKDNAIETIANNL